MDDQLLSFLDAVNAVLKESMIAGDTLVVDEFMVKSFHKNLTGKMKIIRKPRPIGNEFKVVTDGYIPKSCLHEMCTGITQCEDSRML